MDTTETNVMQMFGLTPNQLNILFSVERQLVLKDCQGNAADIDKTHWLTCWCNLLNSQEDSKITLISDYGDLILYQYCWCL